MTRRQAYRYSEVERMDRAGVSIQEQAAKLGLSMGRLYGIRTEARAAGFELPAGAGEGRGRFGGVSCPRCGLRGSHYCTGRAEDYMRSRGEAVYTLAVARRGR